MPLYRIRRALKPLFVLALATLALSWSQKGRFVDSAQIRPELRNEPVQGPTTRQPFDFEYKGKTCSVQPVASWEQWGLVVSHNNIESFADLVHDSTSVDTKDLCVIWGTNVESNDFQRVSYKSGQFTCYFRYPGGVRFDHSGLGNNHLITDRDSIREQIAQVRVGDQVRLSGLLVNYRMDDWQDFWRRTSVVRTDTGCEVVFVEELEILERGTPIWYAIFDAAKHLALIIPLLYAMVFWLEARNPETSRVGQIGG